MLFPTVVDSDATKQMDRLQKILLQGTRLSLVMVVPITVALVLLAGPLVHAWLNDKAIAAGGTVPVLQILSLAVAIRVGNATGTTILKGAGQHRMLAFVNLGTGVANLVLSIVLIKPFGLVGVAYGTLIPIAWSSIFILSAPAGVWASRQKRCSTPCFLRSGGFIVGLRALTRKSHPTLAVAIGIGRALPGALLCDGDRTARPRAVYGEGLRARRSTAARGRLKTRTRGMRGIILAAGKGSRLNGTAGESPKCLVELGGMTLVERQIRLLQRAGVRNITVVTGCQADRVRRACGQRVTYVENPRYAQTNSMYSLWMARPLLYEGFVVLNCDVVFHPVLLDDLLSARHDDALLLAYSEAHQPIFGDEEMKVKVRCGRVVDMSKTMDPAGGRREPGIVKFGPAGAAALVDIMDRLIVRGREGWAPRAFAEFREDRPASRGRDARVAVDRN